MIQLICALTENNAIGNKGELIYYLPADLKHFKALTTGHTIVMGRKTFDSIGKPLPGRTSIVVTRDEKWAMDGVIVAHSVDEALETARVQAQQDSVDEIMIVGGAEIYRQTIEVADRLEITEVHADYDGDAWFPEIEDNVWDETSREEGGAATDDAPAYSFITLEKRSA